MLVFGLGSPKNFQVRVTFVLWVVIRIIYPREWPPVFEAQSKVETVRSYSDPTDRSRGMRVWGMKINNNYGRKCTAGDQHFWLLWGSLLLGEKVETARIQNLKRAIHDIPKRDHSIEHVQMLTIEKSVCLFWVLSLEFKLLSYHFTKVWFLHPVLFLTQPAAGRCFCIYSNSLSFSRNCIFAWSLFFPRFYENDFLESYRYS